MNDFTRRCDPAQVFARQNITVTEPINICKHQISTPSEQTKVLFLTYILFMYPAHNT